MADVAQMYMEIPPVTRFYVTACMIVNGGAMLGYLRSGFYPFFLIF